MRQFFTWWMEHPEWAMIGMSVGALLGLLTQYLLQWP